MSISMGLQQFAIIPTGTPSSMRSKLARIDWGGSLLCIAGSVLILLGFTFSESGWGSEKTIACLILGPIVLGLFVLWEIKVRIGRGAQFDFRAPTCSFAFVMNLFFRLRYQVRDRAGRTDASLCRSRVPVRGACHLLRWMDYVRK